MSAGGDLFRLLEEAAARHNRSIANAADLAHAMAAHPSSYGRLRPVMTSDNRYHILGRRADRSSRSHGPSSGLNPLARPFIPGHAAPWEMQHVHFPAAEAALAVMGREHPGSRADTSPRGEGEKETEGYVVINPHPFRPRSRSPPSPSEGLSPVGQSNISSDSGDDDEWDDVQIIINAPPSPASLSTISEGDEEDAEHERHDTPEYGARLGSVFSCRSPSPLAIDCRPETIAEVVGSSSVPDSLQAGPLLAHTTLLIPLSGTGRTPPTDPSRRILSPTGFISHTIQTPSVDALAASSSCETPTAETTERYARGSRPIRAIPIVTPTASRPHPPTWIPNTASYFAAGRRHVPSESTSSASKSHLEGVHPRHTSSSSHIAEASREVPLCQPRNRLYPPDVPHLSHSADSTPVITPVGTPKPYQEPLDLSEEPWVSWSETAFAPCQMSPPVSAAPPTSSSIGYPPHQTWSYPTICYNGFSPFPTDSDVIPRHIDLLFGQCAELRDVCSNLHNRCFVASEGPFGSLEQVLTRPIITTAIDRLNDGMLQFTMRMWRWTGKHLVRAGLLQVDQWIFTQRLSHELAGGYGGTPTEFASSVLPSLEAALTCGVQYETHLLPSGTDQLSLDIVDAFGVRYGGIVMSQVGTLSLQPVVWASACHRVTHYQRISAAMPFDTSVKQEAIFGAVAKAFEVKTKIYRTTLFSPTDGQRKANNMRYNIKGALPSFVELARAPIFAATRFRRNDPYTSLQ